MKHAATSPRKHRRRKVVACVVTVLLAVGVAVVLARATPSTPSGASPTTTDATTTSGAATTGVNGFYLSIGGSSSLGFQPTGIPRFNGHRTDTGYVNDIAETEAAKGVNLSIRQIGCPGETAQSMLLTGDACYRPPGRQIRAATIYLAQHYNDVGLVTIDIGFNDVRKCMLTPVVDVACADQGIAYVRSDFPAVMKVLVAAAGPRVHFIGFLYEDPFLADYVNPASDTAQANETLSVFAQLNAVLSAVYFSYHVPMANLPGAFQSGNATPVSTKSFGVIPTNVANACSWTWMCTPPPYGPDDHPNNAGYRVIADAVIAVLPKHW